MKIAKIIAAILLSSGLLLGGVACASASDKVETQVYEYLNEKYGNIDFEIAIRIYYTNYFHKTQVFWAK